jgi:hypothetical protein
MDAPAAVAGRRKEDTMKKIKLLGMLALTGLLYLVPQIARAEAVCWYECDSLGCRLVCLADEAR